jgi:PhoPQ-activated pathogenicity-related protein
VTHRPLSLASKAAAMLLACLAPASADLMQYVAKPDASYAWKLVSNDSTETGKIYSLALTSQTWQGIVWTHQLTVYEPAELAYPDAALLFVTGGSTDRKPRPEDHALGFALAKLCGARVALLPQVPNQPLLGDRKEDDLITETFVRYLETKDPTGRCCSRWSRAPCGRWTPCRSWARGRASRSSGSSSRAPRNEAGPPG